MAVAVEWFGILWKTRKNADKSIRGITRKIIKTGLLNGLFYWFARGSKEPGRLGNLGAQKVGFYGKTFEFCQKTRREII